MFMLIRVPFCSRVDCNSPGSSVPGISQARILEWVAISCSRRSSRPRVQTHASGISCTGRRILCHWEEKILYLGSLEEKPRHADEAFAMV